MPAISDDGLAHPQALRCHQTKFPSLTRTDFLFMGGVAKATHLESG